MVLGDGPACGPRGWSWWVVLAGGPGVCSLVAVLVGGGRNISIDDNNVSGSSTFIAYLNEGTYSAQYFS